MMIGVPSNGDPGQDSLIIDGTLPTTSYPADRCHNDQGNFGNEEA
jgi:hypothetical protein